ncbi:crossover junction endodeoxyribonuclease RuvC [PVC group bacterium (ex Bugula neritina AB1)]|nr:crossover junction endodeoxyribonuclease RuvC [PVC group bacterium (ex Bugula neritina AB1)]
MLVLGVDPGTRSMGYGLINAKDHKSLKPIVYGAWRPRASLPLYKRLGFIQSALKTFIHEQSPDVIVLEKSFCGKNVRASMSLGEARGTVLSLAGQFDLELVEYAPTSVKSAVSGVGRATKEQVQKMVKLFLGINDLFKTDDESDALALAITYVQKELIRKCILT